MKRFRGGLLSAALLFAGAAGGEAVSVKRGWEKAEEGVTIRNGVITIEAPEPVTSRFACYDLEESEVAGTLQELSGECRAERLARLHERLHGGKVNLTGVDPAGKRFYSATNLQTGSYDWRPFLLDGYFPADGRLPRIMLGIQQASGKLEFRKLRRALLGVPLNFAPVANMGWQDGTAGDGQGGWTDAGPGDDGRRLETLVKYRCRFDGFPFRAAVGARSIVVMNQPAHFPGGPEHVTVEPERHVAAKYLYLLHTASWMGGTIREFGEISIRYSSGRQQKFVLENSRDLADWSLAGSLPNARPVVTARSGKNARVALYASKFELEPDWGEVKQITFSVLPKRPIWLIVAATLSDRNYMEEFAETVIRENQEWKPFPRGPLNRRCEGSALDLNPFRDDHPCGTYGRVIVSEEGHFAFEKRPEKRLRFFINTVAIGYPKNKKEVDEYVAELCRNGYNMLRIHFLDLNLMRGRRAPLDFNEKVLDTFDYLVHRCRERGIYLNLDCMTNLLGFSHLDPWKKRGYVEHKTRIYFEPEIREQWKNGVSRILTRVNPYTKTRLAEDPALAMVIGYNEQEFAFSRPVPESALRAWREFLRERYRTLEALRRARPDAKQVNSFDELPAYVPGTLERDADLADFAFRYESELLEFYRDSLREMGFRGIFSNYNTFPNKHYLRLRRSLDCVTKNSYEMLMTRYNRPGSSILQTSSIERCSAMLRGSLAARLAGKPFVITEYGIPFWNRYRYEQPFTMGAYASFQDFDGLAAFGDSVALTPVRVINPVRIYTDPVGVANEMLSFFLFQRGDVAAAPGGVTILCREETLVGPEGDRGGPTREEGLLGLLTRVQWRIAAPGETVSSAEPLIPARRGGATRISELHASAGEGSARSGNPLHLLRKHGVLPGSHPGDGVRKFLSSTGELLLDAGQHFMRVETPRFQGICAEGGTRVKLRDFEILEITKRGSLSLVAIDGGKSIADAGRLLLFYVTNALNSNMSFDSPDMRILRNLGGLPTLLECGRFRIRIHSIHAPELRLYVLDLSGKRGRMIPPSRTGKNEAEFFVDTAAAGCTSLCFEIVRQP